jgi:hypothetical protein
LRLQPGPQSRSDAEPYSRWEPLPINLVCVSSNDELA